MLISTLWLKLPVSVLLACLISYASTPVVKYIAIMIGAMDIPREARRMHDHPIPRMGGLAIFIGFLLTTLLFAELDRQTQGILLGAIVITVVGIIDDLLALKAWVKFVGQILAAGIAVYFGVTIRFFMNPVSFIGADFISLQALSLPITMVWIIGVTNAVNLIDGLDGLACGVSAIAAMTMFVVALMVSQFGMAVMLAALLGACVGFLPYNRNPAKIFMGDTGAMLLGYLLATTSAAGLFKFYAVVTFVVPLLALALPLADTGFAFVRRLAKGQSPFRPDRGHLHHRLVDMGLNQKQAVAILYSLSALLGLAAVVAVSEGLVRIILLGLSAVVAVIMSRFIHHTLIAEQPKVQTEEEEEHLETV